MSTEPQKPTPEAELSEKIGQLNTYEPDDCCGRGLRKVDLSTFEMWFCPKCGCEWRPDIVGDVRHWTPREILEVFRR